MRLFAPTITPYHVLAVLGWLVGTAVILFDMFFMVSNDYGHFGLLVAGAAGVLNIRGFIHGRECRDKEMFDLGRETGLRRVE
jgi:hypothetical protein